MIPIVSHYKNFLAKTISINILNPDESFKNKISDIFPEWNSWYKEIKIGGNKNNSKEKNNGGTMSDNNCDNKFNDNNTDEKRKGFFVYPNEKPDPVLDIDDLSDETFLVALTLKVSKFLKFIDVKFIIFINYFN